MSTVFSVGSSDNKIIRLGNVYLAFMPVQPYNSGNSLWTDQEINELPIDTYVFLPAGQILSKITNVNNNIDDWSNIIGNKIGLQYKLYDSNGNVQLFKISANNEVIVRDKDGNFKPVPINTTNKTIKIYRSDNSSFNMLLF